MFQTISYRGCFLHLTTRGNKTTVKIQSGGVITKRSYSLEYAKRLIRTV